MRELAEIWYRITNDQSLNYLVDDSVLTWILVICIVVLVITGGMEYVERSHRGNHGGRIHRTGEQDES